MVGGVSVCVRACEGEGRTRALGYVLVVVVVWVQVASNGPVELGAKQSKTEKRSGKCGLAGKFAVPRVNMSRTIDSPTRSFLSWFVFTISAVCPFLISTAGTINASPQSVAVLRVPVLAKL